MGGGAALDLRGESLRGPRRRKHSYEHWLAGADYYLASKTTRRKLCIWRTTRLTCRRCACALAEARLSAPLFDISRYTRDMESAYQAMFDRLQAGLPPETISVRDDAQALPVPTMSRAKVEAGRMKVAPTIERVSAYAQEGSWLDAENGDPALMLAAAEWGFTPVCLNTRAENFSLFQKLGFETHEQDLCALEAPGRFHVVSLTDLARFQSPADALRAARNLLADDGDLLVAAANAESPLWVAISEAPPASGGHSFYKGQPLRPSRRVRLHARALRAEPALSGRDRSGRDEESGVTRLRRRGGT